MLAHEVFSCACNTAFQHNLVSIKTIPGGTVNLPFEECKALTKIFKLAGICCRFFFSIQKSRQTKLAGTLHIT